MKTSRTIVVLLAVVTCWMVAGQAKAHAQGVEKGAFGLGIILGEPTGLAAKLYLSDDTAVAGAVGSAFIGGGVHLHADYLWHPWVLEETEHFVLPAYVGAGARVLDELPGNNEHILHLGARGVGGMLFDFKEIPLDVFGEVAAVLDFAFDEVRGGVGLNINIGLGARYYF